MPYGCDMKGIDLIHGFQIYKCILLGGGGGVGGWEVFKTSPDTYLSYNFNSDCTGNYNKERNSKTFIQNFSHLQMQKV